MTAAIKTNLVTGFLGTGKTTAIRGLLRNHPRGERWAVLVNEFGEVGVDGQLLADDGITVQEVAGGCLCCVSAPAFTTGLNRLIRQHAPDRILIEPSGLGHPARVLDSLSGPLYSSVLDVRATVCLLDARHLRSPRHLEHETFTDQVHLADVLVANKSDLYTQDDFATFEQFVAALTPAKLRVGITQQGVLDPAWLDLHRNPQRKAAFPEAHAFLVDVGGMPSAPHGDWLLMEGHDGGYCRAGWWVRQQQAWPTSAIRSLLAEVGAERHKGVLLSDSGWQAVNQDAWTPIQAPADGRGRLELLDPQPFDTQSIDQALRQLDGRG